METERAWSEALAREHAHQRELLAAFRGELGEFARECAAALDSLDSFVDGLGGVVKAIELALDTQRRATLALDVARRFPTLSTVQQDDLYVAFGEEGDLPPRIVEGARPARAARAERRRAAQGDRRLVGLPGGDRTVGRAGAAYGG